MKNLDNIPTELLEKELARRQKEKERREIPQPFESPNFDDLQELCVSHVESLTAYGNRNDDIEHYIYEAAMEAIYGKNIWPWINKKMTQ